MTDDIPALPLTNPTFVPNRPIGRYVYINEIGRGSVTVTALFHDPLIERQVVIKTLHSHLSDDQRQLFEKQWIQEAGRLNHPNIVTVYDADKSNDVLYFVMEYLEGNALSDLFNSGHQFTYKQIAELIARVATALDYAHEQDVIHRGIKPASIFITENLIPKLIDFGMSNSPDQSSQTGISEELPKHQDSDLNSDISYANSVINADTRNTNNTNNAFNISGDLSDNTAEQLSNDLVSVETHPSSPQFAAINYQSPEQIKGKAVDARTDIFSLGVVLYQLLCGELPFKGEDNKQLRKAITRSPAIPPQEIRSDVPLRLARIAARALAKKPADRYARASDLAGDLNRYLYREKAKRIIAEQHNTTLGTTFTVVNNADQERQKNKKKRSTIQLLVVTTVVLIAGITSLVMIVPVP
ncbi:serine/threonine-protein kinase, partial [Undibacterium sp. 5I1]